MQNVNATITFTDHVVATPVAEVDQLDLSSDWFAGLMAAAMDFTLENGLTIVGRNVGIGVWEGGAEPSVSVDVVASSIDAIMVTAGDLAAEFGQDAVMVTFPNPADHTTANGFETVIGVAGLEYEEILRAMESYGISGGRIEGSKLIIFSGDPDQNEAAVKLSNDFGLRSARAARAEFVTAGHLEAV